jgi:hypothetical protein
MAWNREMAARLYANGWTVEQIAAAYPAIWRAVDGKICRQPWIRTETAPTMAEVAR